MVGLRRSAFDELRRADPNFPRPIYINRTPLWDRAEVDSWLAAKFEERGASPG